MFDTLTKLLKYLIKHKHDSSKFPKSFPVFDMDSSYKRARKFLIEKDSWEDIGISKEPDKLLLWFRRRKKS